MTSHAPASDPRCVICGNPLGTTPVNLHIGPPFVSGEVRRCGLCGSAQVVPTPSSSALAALYSRDYYDGYAEGPGMAGGIETLPPFLRDRLDELTGRVGKGRILDLGCGEGLFVAFARGQGWNAVGVETSSWAAESGRRRFGVTIFDTPLDAAPLTEGSLDVVHANHVLEHLVDPVGTLRAAHRLLRPGGMLVAEVPQELFTPLADAVLRRVRRNEAQPNNYHIVFFSRRGLRLAAERAGFEVERIDNLRHVEVLTKRSAPFALARGVIYRAERALRRGPVYVVVARRPLA